MCKEKINKTDFSNFIDSLIAGIEEKEAQDNKQLIDKLKINDRISNPEHFNLFVVHKLKQIIKFAFNTKHSDIYVNYNCFESNIRRIIEKREGSGCCADKSRYLIKAFLKYKESGKYPVFEDKYWYPKVGTSEQWMKYIEGLCSLLHGYSEKYMISLKELLEEKQ